MRSRSNQSGPQGWLCAERFLRILLWPWCGPLSISNKISQLESKQSITHQAQVSRDDEMGACAKSSFVPRAPASCACPSVRVSRSALLAILLDPQSMAAPFFAAHLAARQTLAWTGAPQLFAGRSANKDAVCCFETHALAHRTFGGSIRCSFRGRASNRPALKPVPVPSALT